MKNIQRLERVEKLIQSKKLAPAVSIIGRDSDGGFMLRFGLWSGITGKAKDIISHHQTIEAAKAKYEELLSEHGRGDPVLIVWGRAHK